ncbi:hypothetical protein VHEMI01330 [[Torrubiella] hemipterigena]|uniref:NACHT-NTPase and P-loop NTPases N-terminal domain-containing protein n=1 Tax=[Torrubiella] hemipterigena TaxID=1531966 RepID=A0A0A1SSU9_9HYPO|nr:hypothetical protein VHEMI01330 [[Torrubiella] hemipterigena]
MSGLEVLGAISAVISIIDATIQISSAIQDEAGLPANFKTVAVRLPVVSRLLDDAEEYIRRNETLDLAPAFTPVIQNCSTKATQLQQLFQKVIPADGDSRASRYIKAARTIGKGGRVETLMKDILDDLSLLTMQFPDTTSHRGKESLTRAIDEVKKLEPSLPEGFEDAVRFANYGSGPQNINTGSGSLYNNNGAVIQNTGSGQLYNGTNYVASKISTLSFGDQNHGIQAETVTVHGGYHEYRQSAPATPLTPQELNAKRLKVCRNHLRSVESTRLFNKQKSFESANWLLQQDAFQEWQRLGVKGPQAVLLTIKGHNFTGKSVMMRRAVAASSENEKVITLHHFFGGDTKDPIDELLRDLLYQLIYALPEKHKPWEDIRRWGEEIGDGECIDLASCGNLEEIFIRITATVKDDLAIRIFVDDVDDCIGGHAHTSKQDSRMPLDVLEALYNLLSRARTVDADLGICVSRRTRQDYYGKEPPATTIHLEEYINEALSTLIQAKLANVFPEALEKAFIILKMVETGSHNFHWAEHICNEIVKNKDGKMQDLAWVASTPLSDYEALYTSALRSSKASKTHCSHMNLLRVALGSFRPMTAEESLHAHAFAEEPEFKHPTMEAWQASEQGLTVDAFTNYVSDKTYGLLEVSVRVKTSNSATAALEDDDVECHVLFSRRSTATFLRGEKGLAELEIQSRDHLEQECHALLFRICSTVLDKFSLTGSNNVHLLDYACEFWLRHSIACGELPPDKALPEFFMNKCTKRKAQRFIKQQITFLEQARAKESISLKNQTSMTVLLATLGCTTLLRRHIEACDCCKMDMCVEPNAKQPSTVLQASLYNAISTAKFDTAKYLVGLLPRDHLNMSIRGWTLMYTTCFYSKIMASEYEKALDLVKTLLDLGADACEPSLTGDVFPLHLAISVADHRLIEVICEGRDRKALNDIFEMGQGKTRQTALHHAVMCKLAEPRERQAILATLRKLAPDPNRLLGMIDEENRTPVDLADDDDDLLDELELFQS